MCKLLFSTYLFGLCALSEGFLFDWFGWRGNAGKGEISSDVRFEELEPDLAFIEEASKIAGIPLSDLDVCEQKIILKLKSSCGRLNNEELARLSVNLLNCQASIEGRKVYECTDDMTLKECTSEMPPDVWNSYHIVSNRARAVCYAARQQHFRAYAENVVNKLVESTRNHLTSVEEFQEKQKKVHAEADLTLEKLSKNQRQVLVSYSKIKSAETSLISRLNTSLILALKSAEILDRNAAKVAKLNSVLDASFEMSKKRIMEEEKMRENATASISSKLKSVSMAIGDIFDSIIKSASQIDSNAKTVSGKTKEIDSRVEEILVKIESVAQAVAESHRRFSTVVGPDGRNLERISAVLPHFLALSFFMVLSSFLNSSTVSRCFLLVGSALNFALTAIYDAESSFVFFLTICIVFIIDLIMKFYPIKERNDEETVRVEQNGENRVHSWLNEIETPLNHPLNGYRPTNPTPSITSSVKTVCRGHTRAGAPCRNAARKDGIFCFQHS